MKTEETSTEKPEGPPALAPVSLLAARAACVEAMQVECESTNDKGLTRACLLMMLRESAGYGFDQGVKYASAAND